MARSSALLALLLLLFVPQLSAAATAWENTLQTVMASTEVATGTPVTVTIGNRYHDTGYLIVKTENETAAASLVVTVLNSTALGDILVCTMTAITTKPRTSARERAGRYRSESISGDM